LALKVLLFGGLLGGCQLQPRVLEPSQIEALSAELAQLETLVSATRDDLASLSSNQSERMESVSKRLRTIDGDIKQLPGAVQTACQSDAAILPTTTCDDIVTQTILVDDDKMVVGATEHLWITPPGIGLVARIDTGTSTNTIHATDITPFERDGDDWVRFTLAEEVIVERKIVRQLRVSKRPVVRLRVQLGNVFDSFDFILSDRSNSEQPVLLGRTFLQDVALVDVGKEFVQPKVDTAADTEANPAVNK